MKNSQKDTALRLTNDKSIAARYAPIHDMVTALLAKTDPDGYTKLVEELRADWKPVDAEVQIVELMADISCRIRGCLYLETEILKGNIRVCAEPQDTPDMALGRAYIRDFEGPNLLDKLSRYQSKLSSEFSRCIRILQLRAKSRKCAEARIAATLAKHKPCTSVIQ
jgi:hypothetical protein